MTKLLRLFTFLLLLACLLPGVSVAWAQDVTPRHSDPGWQAVYWNNSDLNGAPVIQRQDNDLNFDWGFSSPDRALPYDNFSARWERYIDVTPGTYRFTAVVDDGIRVWIDNDLLINQWREQAVQTYTAEKYLGPGHHLIRVEYFERSGAALAKLSWTLNTPGPTPTPTPTPAPPTTGGWRGEYFNNLTISGAPALVRNDPEINFAWGGGSPAAEIAVDGFSVRWTRNLELPAGNYRFTMSVDDGARLFVNGHTLIDAWKEQAATTYTGDIFLPGGTITVQMEYFESRGGASARLTWQQVSGGGGEPITDWQGEYFNNRNLSGTPALVRNDRTIDFDWGNGSPAPGTLGADEFSVRWTRTLELPAGNYRFTATTDDGLRLFVSGQLLINQWREQPARTVSGDVYLNRGRVAVQMEYFEARGGAVARLRWERIDSPQPPAGSAVIVDNGDPGFVTGGDPRGWRTEPEGYGNSLVWSQNNDQARPNYNWSRWYPRLSPGRYEVFVYIPDRFSTTANARYWVSHQGGQTLRPLDQSAYSNQWVSLGIYTFRGTRDDYVSLADVTFEQRFSRLLAWDAVKWEPR